MAWGCYDLRDRVIVSILVLSGKIQLECWKED